MKTFLKNISLIAIGAILTSTITLYAANIQANINSFTQYIQELFVTSDGTPTGETVLAVQNDGSFIHINPQTNAVIANDMETLGYPAVGMGFQSGGAMGMVTVGSDESLINIDIFGVNENGVAAGVGIEAEDGAEVSLLRIDFSQGFNLNGINVSEDGIRHIGTNDASAQHSIFINETQQQLFIIQNNGHIILPQVQQQFNYSDDSAAEAAGVPLGGLYHDNGSVRIRIQ